jgi:hypothetical protein
MKKNFTFKLFAEPSLIEGVSRLVDLGGTLQEYNASKTENEADYKALRNDWHAVGQDFVFSINNYEQKSS